MNSTLNTVYKLEIILLMAVYQSISLFISLIASQPERKMVNECDPTFYGL